MTPAHILGFPRMGAQREWKSALEAYWKRDIDAAQLHTCADDLQQRHWQMQKDAGLTTLTVGDFAYYDHVLDHSFLVGALPPRFCQQSLSDLDTYFYCARGQAPGAPDVAACEMTKWFDTNYHYLVPEFTADQTFTLSADYLLQRIERAQALGLPVKPVILGPVSYLYLGRAVDGSDRLHLLSRLLPIYRQLLQKLAQHQLNWVQIDEPILALDLPPTWRAAFYSVYQGALPSACQLLLTTYFGGVQHNADLILDLQVAGLHIDAVRGVDDVAALLSAWPSSRVLSLGIVDGRAIWRNDLRQSLRLLQQAQQRFADKLWVASSCSLLHVPIDVQLETALDPDIKNWLAFAQQKMHEVATLAQGLRDGEHSIRTALEASDIAQQQYRQSTRVHNKSVQARVAQIRDEDSRRASPYVTRSALQRAALQLPLLPTTTIGSFPQTAAIRQLRAAYKRKAIDQHAYEQGLKAQIAEHIAQQETLGLDVLVHGEAERNDMVEYFGEQLHGFAFTSNGWVQSYGSRCVKPPIIYGDVSRPKPMTVAWARYAQSLTTKPVKGMLTGPNTILCWSFVRADISREQQAKQIALALRDEVRDLQAAGIRIIQIDEPAIREGLPLRHGDHARYLHWATTAFRLVSSIAVDQTQIHTHMCYSDFNAIIAAIADLDADVITIETSRSHMKLLKAFEDFLYPNEIGPGVYDIHSPNVPTVDSIKTLLRAAAKKIPLERLWVNPDCGLKTREWPEVEQALSAMVTAAKEMRRELVAIA